jgi:hypothetical protein
VLLEQFRHDTDLLGVKRRPAVRDLRDVTLDLAVRARTFPIGVAVRQRLDEALRSIRRH